MQDTQAVLDDFEAEIFRRKPSHIILLGLEQDIQVPFDIDVAKWSSSTLWDAKDAGDGGERGGERGCKRIKHPELEDALPVLPVKLACSDKYALLAALLFMYPAHVVEDYKVDISSCPDEFIDELFCIVDHLNIVEGVLQRVLRAVYPPNARGGLTVTHVYVGEDHMQLHVASLLNEDEHVSDRDDLVYFWCTAKQGRGEVLYGWCVRMRGEGGQVDNYIGGLDTDCIPFCTTAAQDFRTFTSERFVRIAAVAAKFRDERLLQAVANGLYPWTFLDPDIFSKLPDMPMRFTELYGEVARAYGQLNIVPSTRHDEVTPANLLGNRNDIRFVDTYCQPTIDLDGFLVKRVYMQGRDIVLES